MEMTNIGIVMKNIKVNVGYTGDNFCCGWSDANLGTVVVTAKTLESLKSDFEESFKLHIEGCQADGDPVPAYLKSGNYEIDYVLDAAALLRNAEAYTTMAAISRASGINQKQLSHYANGVKKARAAQRERIVVGLRTIGEEVLAFSH